jgi:hypothetical protein
MDSLNADLDSIQAEMQDSVWLNLPTEIGQYGVFAEGSIFTVPGPGGTQKLKRLGSGVCIQRLLIGGFVSEVDETYEKELIFPNTYQMNYKYGGGYIGMHIVQKKPFEIDIKFGMAWGDIVWRKKETDENFLQDRFTVLLPELSLVYVPITYLKLFATAGYRNINNMDISRIEPTELNGMTFGLGISVGFYQ